MPTPSTRRPYRGPDGRPKTLGLTSIPKPSTAPKYRGPSNPFVIGKKMVIGREGAEIIRNGGSGLKEFKRKSASDLENVKRLSRNIGPLNTPRSKSK